MRNSMRSTHQDVFASKCMLSHSGTHETVLRTFSRIRGGYVTSAEAAICRGDGDMNTFGLEGVGENPGLS